MLGKQNFQPDDYAQPIVSGSIKRTKFAARQVAVRVCGSYRSEFPFCGLEIENCPFWVRFEKHSAVWRDGTEFLPQKTGHMDDDVCRQQEHVGQNFLFGLATTPSLNTVKLTSSFSVLLAELAGVRPLIVPNFRVVLTLSSMVLLFEARSSLSPLDLGTMIGAIVGVLADLPRSAVRTAGFVEPLNDIWLLVDFEPTEDLQTTLPPDKFNRLYSGRFTDSVSSLVLCGFLCDSTKSTSCEIE